MKNIKCFPHERNQYFFGKLLTVSDFETEQKYFNDKRRLINRMMFGTGIAAGMNTTRIDSNTIVVESGLAFDGTGREIIIDKSIVKKLSLIDGFHENEEVIYPYLYLCIEYSESDIEPVHSLTDAGSQNDKYNKYSEGYRLYLTTDEPKRLEHGSIARCMQDVQLVYEGNGVRIKQSCPKYAASEEAFDFMVEIEKINQSLPIQLEYELDLLWINGSDESLRVVFHEEEEAVKSHVYQKKYCVQAANVGEVTGSMTVKPDSLKLTLGTELAKQPGCECKNNVHIVSGNTAQRILEEYYTPSLENLTESGWQERLYLAKIYLVKWGSSYEIGDIKKVPFGQYVTNTELNRVLAELSLNKIKELKTETNSYDKKNDSTSHQNSGLQQMIHSGIVSVSLGDAPKEGQVFFSMDIAHGFGPGDVHIILGSSSVLNEDGSDGEQIFGDNRIFADTKNAVNAAFAAKVNPNTGTFKVGVKLNAPTQSGEVKVSWFALKDYNTVKSYSASKLITIKPNLTYVGVRETVWFEAVVEGISDKSVSWSVKEINGGFIDKNGLYTAPNMPGVYEIAAKSVSTPEVAGSAFVAVR